MRLGSDTADIFVPDGVEVGAALARTTHLAIGAHQDDLEIMAYAGIVACFQRDDRWFTGVVTTNGAGSPRSGAYADVSDAGMQAIRRHEQRKAGALGEYAAVVQLGYPSSAVKNAAATAVTDDIATILEATRPEIVYVHNLADKHDTHIATTLRAIAALRRVGGTHRPRQVLGCEVWRDLDWVVDSEKEMLSASAHPNLSAALLGVFDSQIAGGKRYDLATAGRRLANATFCESHATDADTALIYAVDLTPLVTDPTLSPVDHITGFIDRFRAEVRARIERFA